jgi:hypothetical protein
VQRPLDLLELLPVARDLVLEALWDQSRELCCNLLLDDLIDFLQYPCFDYPDLVGY